MATGAAECSQQGGVPGVTSHVVSSYEAEAIEKLKDAMA